MVNGQVVCLLFVAVDLSSMGGWAVNLRRGDVILSEVIYGGNSHQIITPPKHNHSQTPSQTDQYRRPSSHRHDGGGRQRQAAEQEAATPTSITTAAIAIVNISHGKLHPTQEQQPLWLIF
jgi:hypothetical protein